MFVIETLGIIVYLWRIKHSYLSMLTFDYFLSHVEQLIKQESVMYRGNSDSEEVCKFMLSLFPSAQWGQSLLIKFSEFSLQSAFSVVISTVDICYYLCCSAFPSMFGFCAYTGRNRLIAMGIICAFLTQENIPLTTRFGKHYWVSSIAHIWLKFAVERSAIAFCKD